tara:strand:+ start:873 stop:1082 length:210 start_codon:yes stop_codon:yes gene_type:complete
LKDNIVKGNLMSIKVSKVNLELVNSIVNLDISDIGKYCLLVDDIFVFMSPDLDAVNDMKDSLLREKNGI